MTGRSIETRLSRLEQRHNPSAEPVVFRTIYEGKDGTPESETIWWADPATGAMGYGLPPERR